MIKPLLFSILFCALSALGHDLKPETHDYQAEVRSLMNTIIHSMYTDKDIVIRELLNNASDSLNKLRLQALTDPEVMKETSEMRIRVYVEDNTLNIEDTGIGMTKDGLVKFLGTIAKSGTGELLKNAKQSGNDTSSFIGQFGVGFYSVYLVGDRVQVISKSPEDLKQWIWEGNANKDSFTVVEDPKGNTLKRGTCVKIFPKEGVEFEKFLNPSHIETLISKHSKFLPYPIYLEKDVEVIDKKDEESEDKDKKDDEEKEEEKVEDEKEKEDEKPKEKKFVKEFVQVNQNKPPWLKDPKAVTEEEYKAFYSEYFKDSAAPVGWVHIRGTGETEFTALIFIHNPKYSLFSARPEKDEQRNTVSLYVRRVFVKQEQFFSESLSPFISGIIDSDDLPLNVSRQMLQENDKIQRIRQVITNRVLDKLADLAKTNMEAFEKFYTSFSSSLKVEIIHSDESHRKRLANLLYYPTTLRDKPISLAEYVAGKKDGQKSIYFIAGKDVNELKENSLVEGLVADGIEVILATGPPDEYALQALGKYENLEFKNVAKDKGVESKVSKELQEEFKDTCEWLKKDVLSKDVSDVVISSRLARSSCAVAASEHGLTARMKGVLEGAEQDNFMYRLAAMQLPVFLLNPKHSVMIGLKDAIAKNRNDANAKAVAKTLFDAAYIRSGYSLKNSKQFMDNIDRLVIQSLGGSIPVTEESIADNPEESASAPKKSEELEEKSDDKADDSTSDRDEL